MNVAWPQRILRARNFPLPPIQEIAENLAFRLPELFGGLELVEHGAWQSRMNLALRFDRKTNVLKRNEPNRT